MPTVRRVRRYHLAALLGYGLMALILTWPLVAQIATHVPGNGADDPPLTWNLWWVQHAILDLGQNPFDGSALFYPLGINLAFYTLTVLNGILSIPLQATLGLVPTSNVLLLASFVLSGYGAFLLCAYMLSRSARDLKPSLMVVCAYAGGVVYAFASSKLFYAALGQWNIASSQWIPFFVLYLFKLGDESANWRNGVLAGLFLIFQAYAELTYATFLVVFAGLWLIWRVFATLRMAREKRSWRFVLNLLIALGIFFVGVSPMLATMIPEMMVEGDVFAERESFADVFSADLVGFLVPTELHPILGGLVDAFHFDHTVGQHIFLGYTVLILAAAGVATWWRRSSVRFWTLAALLFWLLTLGPTLRVNGNDSGLPLPFAVVAALPFLKGNRYPSRYSVILFLCLAVLVAFGVASLVRWVMAKSKLKAGSTLVPLALLVIAAIGIFEHLSAPLALSDMRIPPVYEEIAKEMPGDYTLLDLPVAWRNGFRVTGTLDPIIMFEQYYQTAHGKRILAGNTSRNPPLKFQYFSEAPVISSLIALETGHVLDPGVEAGDRLLAKDVLRFFGIEAIVIHPEQAGTAIQQYVENTMPVQGFHDKDGIVAYRVDLPAEPGRWALQPGDELSRLSFAEGWGPASEGVIWAQRGTARLLVPLRGDGQTMAFSTYVPGDGQGLVVEANGERVSQMTLAAGWNDAEIRLPPGAAVEGLDEVLLRFQRVWPASEVRLSARAIGETGVVSPASLVAQSAGQEVGDFGHVFVDGRDVSPNQRGYNVVVLDPETGEVRNAEAFDTHIDAGANAALHSFLHAVPNGQIVVVVAADEVSRLLDQEGVNALRLIGAADDLRDRFRWGHAVIGVRGAEPGTAAESSGWMQPVTVVVGDGATEPHLAAGFSTFVFASAGIE